MRRVAAPVASGMDHRVSIRTQRIPYALLCRIFRAPPSFLCPLMCPHTTGGIPADLTTAITSTGPTPAKRSPHEAEWQELTDVAGPVTPGSRIYLPRIAVHPLLAALTQSPDGTHPGLTRGLWLGRSAQA